MLVDAVGSELMERPIPVDIFVDIDGIVRLKLGMASLGSS